MATDSQQTAGPAWERVVAQEKGAQQKVASNPRPRTVWAIMAGNVAGRRTKGNVALARHVCYGQPCGNETDTRADGELAQDQ